MASDDPSKRGVDRRFVAWQDSEIDYVVIQLAGEYPKTQRFTIRAAVESCKVRIQPSEGRMKLLACARARLG